MNKNVILIIIFLILISINTTTSSYSIFNQNHYMNLIQLKSTNEPYEGYLLFSPEFTTKTYLIDNEGETLHSWAGTYIQGLPVYLLENGNLIRGCSKLKNPRFISGGVTGRVDIQDWNGSLIWEFDYSTNQYCLHHDIEVLPNGNILMVAWEYKSVAEAIAAGRNPNTLQSNQLWPDKIIEVKPTGVSTGNIVWEWHVWDHLIQEFDSSKDNYGSVAEHPELIDINSGGSQADFNHINSIDYNEVLDQILLSSHNQNEIWIIDHSTTIKEAAGHTGGRYGKGGDLLYRWGNPQLYDHGESIDQQLFGQHDAQWIESNCPGEGNILIFNNGMGRTNGRYSSIVEIIPPVDENGSYKYTSNTPYLPIEPIWIYTAENPFDFFAPKISGAQRLPNGNTLICSGDQGYFFEVTEDKQTVWDFQNPYPSIGKKNVFKIRKYNPSYPGLKFLSQRPNTPNVPQGSSIGTVNYEYVYSTTTTDPNDDKLFYIFDWGDGTKSDWIGPIPSGKMVNETHIWEISGNYNVRVKAKDIHDFESEWSESLSITMPKVYNNKLSTFFTCIEKILISLNQIITNRI